MSNWPEQLRSAHSKAYRAEEGELCTCERCELARYIEQLKAEVEQLKAEQRYTFDDWRVLVEAQQLLEKMPQPEVKEHEQICTEPTCHF